MQHQQNSTKCSHPFSPFKIVKNWENELAVHTHIKPKVLSSNKADNFYVFNSESFINLNSPCNDFGKQPLFGLFSAPFGVIVLFFYHCTIFFIGFNQSKAKLQFFNL